MQQGRLIGGDEARSGMREHMFQVPRPREDMEVRMVLLPPFRVREEDDHYDHLLAPERRRRAEFQEKWDSRNGRV